MENRINILRELLSWQAFDTSEKNHLATTLLSWRPEEAELSTSQIKELLKYRPESDSIILGGDFNATDDEQVIPFLREKFKYVWRTSMKGFTWCLDNPLISHSHSGNGRKDYIFCSSDLVSHHPAVVLNHPNPVYASDHFGVVVQVF